jgi:hypothetical protein
VTEHLANCAECARFAEAEREVAGSLRTLKSTPIEPSIPLALLRQRIETKAAKYARKEITVMSSLVKQIRIHPRASVGVALAVALFLFVTLVPFSYQRIGGYAVTVVVPDVNADAPPDIQGALALLGHANVAIKASLDDNGATYEIGDFPSRSAAREAGAAVKALCGKQGTVSIEPVMETVSGNLYAQVRDRLITIQIDGTGLSDPELESEISAKLAEKGFTATSVSVSTSSDGLRQISISAEAQNAQDSLQLELKLGDTVCCNGPTMIQLANDSTMTDDELKAELEAKLRAQGCTNLSVVVTRTPDGKREVRVEANK